MTEWHALHNEKDKEEVDENKMKGEFLENKSNLNGFIEWNEEIRIERNGKWLFTCQRKTRGWTFPRVQPQAGKPLTAWDTKEDSTKKAEIDTKKYSWNSSCLVDVLFFLGLVKKGAEPDLKMAGGSSRGGQCRSHRTQSFHLWVGKIPGRRKWQLTSVFLPDWALMHRG